MSRHPWRSELTFREYLRRNAVVFTIGLVITFGIYQLVIHMAQLSTEEEQWLSFGIVAAGFLCILPFVER